MSATGGKRKFDPGSGGQPIGLFDHLVVRCEGRVGLLSRPFFVTAAGELGRGSNDRLVASMRDETNEDIGELMGGISVLESTRGLRHAWSW